MSRLKQPKFRNTSKRKGIKLTQERLKELVSYCPESGVFTWIVKTGPVSPGKVAGVKKANIGKNYIHIHIDGHNYYAHRLAFLYMDGQFPEDQVDHIDGNGLNNKLSNLRKCSSLDNKRNMRMNSRNTSGICGVDFSDGKWRARININGKEISLGRFDDKEEAKKARKAAEAKYGFHKNHGKKRPRYGAR